MSDDESSVDTKVSLTLILARLRCCMLSSSDRFALNGLDFEPVSPDHGRWEPTRGPGPDHVKELIARDIMIYYDVHVRLHALCL